MRRISELSRAPAGKVLAGMPIGRMPIVLSLAGVLIAAGCRAPAFPAYRASPARAGSDALAARLPERAATPVLAACRAVLAFRSLEENLTLHAVLFPRGGTYLVAAGDFGREVFAAGRSERGFRSRGDPRKYPPDLLEGLVDGIDLALLPPGRREVEAVEIEGGEEGLLARKGGKEVLLRARGGSLRIEFGEGGRRTGEAIAEDWERDGEGRPVRPRRVILSGDAVPFRAEIDVLRMEPADLDEGEVEASLREGGEP